MRTPFTSLLIVFREEMLMCSCLFFNQRRRRQLPTPPPGHPAYGRFLAVAAANSVAGAASNPSGSTLSSRRSDVTLTVNPLAGAASSSVSPAPSCHVDSSTYTKKVKTRPTSPNQHQNRQQQHNNPVQVCSLPYLDFSPFTFSNCALEYREIFFTSHLK